MERSISPDSILLLKTAQANGVTTAWDRYEAQLPQCGFGETGLCCRHCLQGPCRIDPFGATGPKYGICGASADVIVARGLARSIAGGTSSHSAHAKHLAHTMLKYSRGEAPDYSIKDQEKFNAVLARVGIQRDGKSDQELAGDVQARSFHLAANRFRCKLFQLLPIIMVVHQLFAGENEAEINLGFGIIPLQFGMTKMIDQLLGCIACQ